MQLLRMIVVLLVGLGSGSRILAQWASSVSSLAERRDYVLKRISSYDRSGGNADYRRRKNGCRGCARLAALATPANSKEMHWWLR